MPLVELVFLVSRVGIRGVALDWVKNYLCDRLQYVQYNDCASKSKLIQCGVPQGSILGPLLFLLYTNDISHVSNVLDLILFADDTKVVKDPTLEFKGLPLMPLMTSLFSASTQATEIICMQNYDVTLLGKPGPTVTGSATN